MPMQVIYENGIGVTRKKLLGESLILLILRAGGVVLQLFTTLYLVKQLSLPEMGLYSLFYAAMGMTRALGPLGMDQSSTRLISVAPLRILSDELITSTMVELSVLRVLLKSLRSCS